MQEIPNNKETPPFEQGFAPTSFENLEVGRYYYLTMRDVDGNLTHYIVRISDARQLSSGRTVSYEYESYYKYNQGQQAWEELNPPMGSPASIMRSSIIQPGEQAIGFTFYRPMQGGKRKRKTRRGGRRHRRKTVKK